MYCLVQLIPSIHLPRSPTIPLKLYSSSRMFLASRCACALQCLHGRETQKEREGGFCRFMSYLSSSPITGVYAFFFISGESASMGVQTWILRSWFMRFGRWSLSAPVCETVFTRVKLMYCVRVYMIVRQSGPFHRRITCWHPQLTLHGFSSLHNQHTGP